MFKDQVVLVTGAGQGIGAEIAREFAKDGAIVAVVDFNQETAEKVAPISKLKGDNLSLSKLMYLILSVQQR